MEDRLTQCLNEIMYSGDCPATLRQVLDSVNILNEEISAFDVNDFEEYIQSSDFSDRVYELFGVDLGVASDTDVPVEAIAEEIHDNYKDEAVFDQAVDLVIEQLDDMDYTLGVDYTEEDVISAVSKYNWL